MNVSNLVEVNNLRKFYPIWKGFLGKAVGSVKAVDGVSLTIHEKETFGLVGESGCGKSTLGRLLLRLEEPTEGTILFKGQDILKLDKEELRLLREKMQIIFQDPYSSLNPRYTVSQLIMEPLIIHKKGETRFRKDRVMELIKDVGLQEEHLDRYPHEFSGGQRQRIGIARALALDPEFLVCDEPVSALDVSIQAQVINLLQELQRKYGLAYLFISHDLLVIEHLCNRIAVMYLGRIVELSPTEMIFEEAMHPYTQALLAASPIPDPDVKRERIILVGDVPSPITPPPGCHFHTRCPKVFDRCREERPVLRELKPDHFVSCFLYE
ncbi:MAG: ABC transporter ATP-binding protein [Thermodesulfobacteriota bacterium]